MKKLLCLCLAALLLCGCQQDPEPTAPNQTPMLTGSITGTLAAYEQTEEGLLLAVVHEVSRFSVLVTDNTSYSSDLKERINLRETGMDIVVDCKFPAENFNGVYHAVKTSIPDTPTQTTEPSTQPDCATGNRAYRVGNHDIAIQ